ncbi:MAG: BlaI/MecI/CopY family transcriptional regulator [Gemmatimonadetes bacterium]|nr:BlaI/MecI/CopY family transcriptional regulator [Gemmatimonadota bacterium]
MLDGSTLTELQLDILRVLWDQGEATTQDVHDALASTRGLAPTTVSTLLSRLEKKGILAHRRQGRQHVYRPLVDEGQVRRSKVRGLTDALFGGDSAALVSHLVRSDDIDEAELARIRQLLDDRTRDEERGE